MIDLLTNWSFMWFAGILFGRAVGFAAGIPLGRFLEAARERRRGEQP